MSDVLEINCTKVRIWAGWYMFTDTRNSAKHGTVTETDQALTYNQDFIPYMGVYIAHAT